MNTRIDDIFSPLLPFWTHIACRPMSASSLAQLAAAISAPLPRCLYDYLSRVGLLQDLTIKSDIQVFASIKEYVSAYSYLHDGHYKRVVDNRLLPFGTDGAGNDYALLETDDGDAEIYFLDHENNTITTTGTTFFTWLSAVVTRAIATIDQRQPNTSKCWSVQFSFQDSDLDDILRAMAQIGTVSLLERDWQIEETSSSGVRRSIRHLQFAQKQLRIKRLEYPGWNSTLYVVDLCEPWEQAGEVSIIQQLDDRFSNLVGCTMGNWGPVPSTLCENLNTLSVKQ